MDLETTNFTMTINKSKLIFKNTNIIAKQHNSYRNEDQLKYHKEGKGKQTK